jgi:hypothetical protein
LTPKRNLWLRDRQDDEISAVSPGKFAHEVSQDLAALYGESVVTRRAHTACLAMAEEPEETMLLSFGDKLRIEFRLRRFETNVEV